MAQCIRLEIECKVAIVVPTEGVSADELVLSVMAARDELGTRMVSAAIEGIQEYLVERKRLPKAAAAHECWPGESSESSCATSAGA